MTTRASLASLSILMAAALARAQCPVEFADPINIPVGGVSVAVGDINGDTVLDVADVDQVSGNVHITRGNGDGTFQASVLVTTLNGTCCGAAVRLFDVSGDNLPDLVAVRNGAGVAVMINNGAGGFGAPTYYAVSNLTDTPVFDIGPITVDGTLGIAVPTTDGVAVLKSLGGGVFTSATVFGAGEGISARVAQILDLRPLGLLIAVNSGNGVVFEGDGLGAFPDWEDFNWGNGERGMVSADMNGDGLPDLVREEAAGGVSVSLLTPNGEDTFGPKQTFGFGSAWYLKAADFNRDDLTDILAVSFGAGNIRVYLGRGDGTLAYPVEFAPGALEPAVGDVNGDEWPDIVLTGQLRLQTPSSAVLDAFAAAPALNGSVRAILPYLEQNNRAASEQTVVAGSFTKFGVTPLARIALFDGATYSPMADGLNGTVNALAHHDLVPGDFNPSVVIAGGAFTKSGKTLKLPKIAAFDGKFWNPLGDAPIVPPAAKNGEGAFVVGWGAAGLVCQQRLLPSDMPSLRPGDVILGFALRVQGGLPAFPTAEKTWPRFDIALGKGVDVMSDTFVANFDGKPTRVRTGPLVMPAGAMPGGASPNQFGQYILFDKPFTYKGGNLLIETRSQSTGEGLVADAFGPPETTGALRNFVDNANASGADGLVANNGGSRSWAIKLLTIPGPASGFNGNVNALVSGIFAGQTARGADPVLVAGGKFTKSGATVVNRIAMWDGDKWIPIGAGFNGAVNALAIFDPDGEGDDGPILVAAGAFTKSGAAVLNRIAYFDGANWQPFGTGFNGAVNALAIHNFGEGPQLVAGGAFTKAGLTPLNRVARFDGQNWSPIGEGFKSTVNSLVSETLLDTGAPALFAGGAFTKSGLSIVNRLAIWQNGAWVQLGDGAPSTVRALARTDNAHSALGPHLKVGGDFKKIGALVQPFVTAFGCPAVQLRTALAALPPGVVPPCSIADLAGGGKDGDRPDGQVTVDDAMAFITIISAYEPAALDDALDALDAIDAADDEADAGKNDEAIDLPEGETTLTDDVIAFVQAYLDGCP